MPNVEARYKAKGKNFEIFVDLDNALRMKRNEPIGIDNVLAVNDVFYDIKKGLKASSSDLKECFGISDAKEVAVKIIKNGEIVLPSEYKKKEQEAKVKQVIDFLARNSIDPTTKKPHSAKRIEDAIIQAGVNIENKSVEQQIAKILSKLKPIIPISLETKKLKIVIPALHTGKVYGLIQDYKEKEEWLANGDLLCIINIPAGLEMDFYDKLNSVTHGSSLVEEVKAK